MPRVISIHDYRFKPGVSTDRVEETIERAINEGLFDLPGLENFHFLLGIKGDAEDRWTAIWVYTSRKAWEQLWGTTSAPKSKDEYPDRWRRWEDDLLAPLLAEDPDKIRFTAYEEVFGSSIEGK